MISIRRHTTKAFRSWAPVQHVPTYVLENAINLSRYAVGAKDRDLVERFGLAGKRVIIALSRLGEPYIGVDEVLCALAHVVRQVPDAISFVAGDGPELPRLREKAKALGLSRRTVFAGFVPDERKADYYRLADVYAMPGSGPDFDRYPLRFRIPRSDGVWSPWSGHVARTTRSVRSTGPFWRAKSTPIRNGDRARHSRSLDVAEDTSGGPIQLLVHILRTSTARHCRRGAADFPSNRDSARCFNGEQSGEEKYTMHLIHRNTCRVCQSAALSKVIDLGEQHLQGSFVKTGKELPPLRKIPLRLLRCDTSRDERACGLLQLEHSTPPGDPLRGILVPVGDQQNYAYPSRGHRARGHRAGWSNRRARSRHRV